MKVNLVYALSTKDFLWSSDSKILSAEASDVRFDGGYRLYDDAYDYGIWMKSHRTGAIEPFVLCNISYSLDEEIQFWEFDNSSIGVKVKIFND